MILSKHNQKMIKNQLEMRDKEIKKQELIKDAKI